MYIIIFKINKACLGVPIIIIKLVKVYWEILRGNSLRKFYMTISNHMTEKNTIKRVILY